MYYRYLILLSFFLAPLVRGQAQAVRTADPPPDHLGPASDFTFTVAPLSLVGSHRRLRAGVIWHRYRWNYLLDLEYAPGLRGWGDISGESRHHFLYGVRPEVRYAFHDRGYLQHFVGVEVPINYLEVLVDNGRFYNATGQYVAFDQGVRHRERISLLAKYTLAAAVTRRLHLEAYTGFGVARRRNYYRGLVNVREENDFLLGDVETGWGPTPGVGTDWVLDLALGFRIGYRL